MLQLMLFAVLRWFAQESQDHSGQDENQTSPMNWLALLDDLRSSGLFSSAPDPRTCFMHVLVPNAAVGSVKALPPTLPGR